MSHESFLESLGLPDPAKILRDVRATETDLLVIEAVEAMVANANRRLAPWLHRAVTENVLKDPALLALADQLTAEFRDTAICGRQPVGAPRDA